MLCLRKLSRSWLNAISATLSPGSARRRYRITIWDAYRGIYRCVDPADFDDPLHEAARLLARHQAAIYEAEGGFRQPSTNRVMNQPWVVGGETAGALLGTVAG